MPACCAINCSNRSGGNVSLYRLPINQPERYAQWVKNINREGLSPHSMLCEKHFATDQFEPRTDKKVLKWNAIPTIFESNFKYILTSSTKRARLDSQQTTLICDQLHNDSENLPEHPYHEHLIKTLESQIRNLQEQLRISNEKNNFLTEKNNSLTKNLARIFEADQIAMLSDNSNGYSVRWCNSTVRKCLKLYLTCGTSGYEELIKQNYPLPSIRTLQRRIASFKCMPEIHDEIFNLLKVKVECLLQEERNAVLLLDEMAIKPGLQFDNNSGEIIGKPTMKNSGGTKSDEFATHALVFMLAGVSTRWKQVVAYQFTSNSFDSNQANDIIYKIIAKCEAINLNTCAIVSDMGPQNQAIWRLNGIKAGRFSKITNFKEYNLENNKVKQIFFLPDPTHIYKNIRLSMTEGNVFYLSPETVKKFNLPSNEITIEAIRMVVEEDKLVDLKIAPYLKEIYLEPNHYDKMKVQGAMAILNNDVSAAIKYYVAKGKIEEKHLTTAWFLEKIHKWYHIMSSRVSKHGLSKNNIPEYNETINFLQEIIEIFANMRIGLKGWWKPLQTGIILATKGILDLQDQFLNCHNFQYLLLSRFTQDALENLFSNIRLRNPVPTAKEFKTALRLISVAQFFKETKHGNYGVTDDIQLVDLLTKNNNEEKINLECLPSFNFDSVSNDHIGQIEKESLFYLLGSIIHNIKTNQIHCTNCFEAIIAQNLEAVSELKHVTVLKSYKEGSLVYPSKAIFDTILEGELFFRKQTSQLIAGNVKLEQLSHSFLNSINTTQYPECHNIIKHVVNLFYKNRLFILLKKYNELKPALPAKCASKSIGMRTAIQNL